MGPILDREAGLLLLFTLLASEASKTLYSGVKLRIGDICYQESEDYKGWIM